MKVVILCGGQGTRIRELTDLIPKPMVRIGDKPILWHIMNSYAKFGYNDFILALGYKGEIIKDYFMRYDEYTQDFEINLKSGNIKLINPRKEDWNITLVDTGEKSMTGSRIKKIQKFIDTEDFFLTYGDGLSNVNINDELLFHQSHGKVATTLGVNPPSRFGELVIDEHNTITKFIEKAKTSGTQGFINGGFYVLNKKVFNYLSDDDSCIFEKQPLEKLASEKNLQVYKHNSFWQCMDTFREYQILNEMADELPWLNND